jgi:hypothetical protein
MYRSLVLLLCSILIAACGASSQIDVTQAANTPIAAAGTKTPVATTSSPYVTPTFQAATATKEPTIIPTVTEADTPIATAIATATATATRRPATRTFIPTGPTNTPAPTRTPRPTFTAAAPAAPVAAEGCPDAGLTPANIDYSSYPEESMNMGDEQYTGNVINVDPVGHTITIQHVDSEGNPTHPPRTFNLGPMARWGDDGIVIGHIGEPLHPFPEINNSETWLALRFHGQDAIGKFTASKSGCLADITRKIEIAGKASVYILTDPGNPHAKMIDLLR